MTSPSPPDSPAIIDWLARRYPTAKRQTLRRMLQAGRVRVNGRPVTKASQRVASEDQVAVTDCLPPAGAAAPVGAGPHASRPRPLPFQVRYEDDDLLVVNKPPGLLTSTVPRERRPTLLALVRKYVARREPAARVGLIHRLDRDASGLLVLSKNHAAYRALKQQFFDHAVERLYTAVVRGVPTPRSGRVESRLVERADGTVYSTRRPGEGERAVSEYEVVAEVPGRSLVRVKLHTGRKHQIRVHLGERDAPIVGDVLYGNRKAGEVSKHGRQKTGAPREEGPLLLAATKLVFTHPRTGRPMTFELPPPSWSVLSPLPAAGRGVK